MSCAVKAVGNQNGFMADELKRLNGELNALDRSIGQLERERASTDVVEFADVTDALQSIDPVWEVLHPDEQRRVLELLVEKITVLRNVWRFGSGPTASSRSPVNWARLEREAMIDHVGKSQQENHPGLTVSRDGDAIVVRIPVRFHRRNGRQACSSDARNGWSIRRRHKNGGGKVVCRTQRVYNTSRPTGHRDRVFRNGSLALVSPNAGKREVTTTLC